MIRKAIDWPVQLSVIVSTIAGEARRRGHEPEQAGGDLRSWQGTCWHSGLFLDQRKNINIKGIAAKKNSTTEIF